MKTNNPLVFHEETRRPTSRMCKHVSRILPPAPRSGQHGIAAPAIKHVCTNVARTCRVSSEKIGHEISTPSRCEHDIMPWWDSSSQHPSASCGSAHPIINTLRVPHQLTTSKLWTTIPRYNYNRNRKGHVSRADHHRVKYGSKMAKSSLTTENAYKTRLTATNTCGPEVYRWTGQPSTRNT